MHRVEVGERIGMRRGLWVARAEGGLLAAPMLPRVPNSHGLLAPMPNAVRLHQVAPPGCALGLACMAV